MYQEKLYLITIWTRNSKTANHGIFKVPILIFPHIISAYQRLLISLSSTIRSFYNKISPESTNVSLINEPKMINWGMVESFEYIVAYFHNPCIIYTDLNVALFTEFLLPLFLLSDVKDTYSPPAMLFLDFNFLSWLIKFSYFLLRAFFRL